MREIKFRAWDTQNSKMNNSWPDLQGLDYYGLNGGDRFKVMQYTGLKDKNGKEIYEGDILQGDYGEQTESKRTTLRGEVYFYEACFKCQMYGWRDWALSKMNTIDFKCHWRDTNHHGGKDWFYVLENIEVIGNIYETPELLEASDE